MTSEPHRMKINIGTFGNGNTAVPRNKGAGKWLQSLPKYWGQSLNIRQWYPYVLNLGSNAGNYTTTTSPLTSLLNKDNLKCPAVLSEMPSIRCPCQRHPVCVMPSFWTARVPSTCRDSETLILTPTGVLPFAMGRSTATVRGPGPQHETAKAIGMSCLVDSSIRIAFRPDSSPTYRHHCRYNCSGRTD